MKRETKIQIIELIIFDLFDQHINPDADLNVQHKIIDMFKKTIDFNVEISAGGQYSAYKYTLPISEIDNSQNDDIYRFSNNIAEHLLGHHKNNK